MSILVVAGILAVLGTIAFLAAGPQRQQQVAQGINILGIMVGLFCLILLGVLFFAIVTA